jgi:hypothetical protein
MRYHSFSVKAGSEAMKLFLEFPVLGSTGSPRTKECASSRINPFALSLSKGEQGGSQPFSNQHVALNRIRMMRYRLIWHGKLSDGTI